MNQRQYSEQILDEFAAEHSHDRETLDRYISLYPEGRAALLALAAEIRLVSDEARFSSEVIEDPAAGEAWSLFSLARTEVQRTTNPFRRFTGKQFADLSKGLGVSRGFMIGIRDRRVLVDSIPERFFAAASKIMEVAAQELRSYLNETPQVPATAEFKSDKKPTTVNQVTFEQLINDTEMSEEQRKIAMEYMSDDRSD